MATENPEHVRDGIFETATKRSKLLGSDRETKLLDFGGQ